ncbi:HTH-type transcriptional activator RhaS [compost metagenome]
MVVYHRRPGGQSQFAQMSELEPRTDRIRRALAYADEHLAEPLSTETLADAASLSPRQFTRVFRDETGETPAKAVERLRAEAARLRLVESAEPIEIIARSVGFADPERMRRAFQRLYGQSPQTMRRLGRAQTPTGEGNYRWPE